MVKGLGKIKTCSKCKEDLPISRFSKDTGTRDGFYAWCKPCKQSQQRSRSFEPAQDGEKKCNTCGLIKHIIEFKKAKHCTSGRGNECRDCLSFREIQYRYSLSKEDWHDLLSHQQGGCAICGELDQRSRVLNVDHCHNTGKIRGLLCNSCNRGLGYLKDDAEILLKASNYIRKHK